MKVSEKAIFVLQIFQIFSERPVKRKRRIVSSSSEDSVCQPMPKHQKSIFIQDEAEISGHESEEFSDDLSEHNSFIDDSEINENEQPGKITLPQVFRMLKSLN